MESFLLSPPVVFVLFLAISFGVSFISKRLSARGVDSTAKNQAYACGETMEENRGQPDYTEFFKFAFFFTIMHVVALVVATDPAGLTVTSGVYLGVTVLSLFMLLRR
jgi:NADH:ubiquinone oxidoreductase subunit 3 (subunit A)